MACEYCIKEKVLMKRDVINPAMIQWVGGVKASDVCDFEYELGVFIDSRGYLRLVDVNDRGCLDHGEKVKISFCPFCGQKFEK